MSCITCGHTMHGIGHVPPVGGEPVFWCPRCGTIENHTDGITDMGVPKLVDRCRTFEKSIFLGPLALGQWTSLGIAESIHVPGQRSTDHA